MSKWRHLRHSFDFVIRRSHWRHDDIEWYIVTLYLKIQKDGEVWNQDGSLLVFPSHSFVYFPGVRPLSAWFVLELTWAYYINNWPPIWIDGWQWLIYVDIWIDGWYNPFNLKLRLIFQDVSLVLLTCPIDHHESSHESSHTPNIKHPLNETMVS